MEDKDKNLEMVLQPLLGKYKTSNAATSPTLARLIGLQIEEIVPLFGCSSHKLHLAVMTFIETH